MVTKRKENEENGKHQDALDIPKNVSHSMRRDLTHDKHAHIHMAHNLTHTQHSYWHQRRMKSKRKTIFFGFLKKVNLCLFSFKMIKENCKCRSTVQCEDGLCGIHENRL